MCANSTLLKGMKWDARYITEPDGGFHMVSQTTHAHASQPNAVVEGHTIIMPSKTGHILPN